jgi:hypothetical protein
VAIGPVGSAVFANQMTPVASTAQTSLNNRVDFQNMIAQSMVNEKKEKVMEVRPTEENQEVDPDKEHTKNEADQETKKRAKQVDNEEDEGFSIDEPKHILDIKV